MNQESEMNIQLEIKKKRELKKSTTKNLNDMILNANKNIRKSGITGLNLPGIYNKK